MRAVILRPGEDGLWVVECPSLPGCVSQGKTKAEAIANIKEAIEGWTETMKAHGQPIPEEDFDTQVLCVLASFRSSPGENACAASPASDSSSIGSAEVT